MPVARGLEAEVNATRITTRCLTWDTRRRSPHTFVCGDPGDRAPPAGGRPHPATGLAEQTVDVARGGAPQTAEALSAGGPASRRARRRAGTRFPCPVAIAVWSRTRAAATWSGTGTRVSAEVRAGLAQHRRQIGGRWVVVIDAHTGYAHRCLVAPACGTPRADYLLLVLWTNRRPLVRVREQEFGGDGGPRGGPGRRGRG
jgi:hypothetical protein